MAEPLHAGAIAAYLRRSRLDYRTAAGAGRYSFITPFPGAVKRDLGAVAWDPDGFDRRAFHRTLGPLIADFPRAALR